MNRTKRTDAKRMKHPNSSSPSNRLQKFLVAVPVAGVGLGAATSSNAAIVNFDLSGLPGGGLTLAPGSSSYISFDLTLGTYALNNAKPANGFYLQNLGAAAGNNLIMKPWTGNAGVRAGSGYNSAMIDKLALNDTISSAGTWQDYNNRLIGVTWAAGYQNWPTPSTGYMAFRVDLGGGNFDYGWASVDYHVGGNNIKFTDFAFENTPNASILAGVTQVPEPKTSALILLAAGALGTAAYRRRKAVAT